jgi:copper chaperone
MLRPAGKGAIVSTAVLKVEGMSCGHCVAAVKRALESVAGVRSAEVDLGGGQAVVEYEEGRTTPGALVGAVMDEGYKAEEAA